MEIILTHEQADFDAAASVLAAWLLDPSRIPVLPKRRNRNLAAFLEDYQKSFPFCTWSSVPLMAIKRIYITDTQKITVHKRIENVNDVVVWDHHPHQHIWPDRAENIYESTGACTTFLVEKLSERQDVHPGRLFATLLLMGIYEDTGFLSYGTTTSRDIRAAAWLMDQGADPDLMRRYVLTPLTEHQQSAFDLLMRSCSSHEILRKKILIAAADVREISDEFSAVAHHMRDLLSPDGLVLLFGTKGGVRMICRGATDEIDFGALMKHFGGGGHARAASALVPFDDVDDPNVTEKTEKLTAEILRVLPEYIQPMKKNLWNKIQEELTPQRRDLIKQVTKTAQQMGMPVYIVGGVVRDLLLDRPMMDFDIVVEGDATRLGKQLAAEYGGNLAVYPQFFTARWEPDHDMPDDGLLLDLISARSEIYEAPGELPVVKLSDIGSDLRRRDFTINTLAIRLDGETRGEVLDICGGFDDLQKGLIRTLHERSFIDDPTRMFRAVRFEQRFGFLIEPDTLRQLREQLEGIENLTGQRIWHELKLFCAEPCPEADFARIVQLGMAAQIHPGLVWSRKIEEDCLHYRTLIPEKERLFPSGNFETEHEEEGPLWVWFSALPREYIDELEERLLLSGYSREGIEYTWFMRGEFPLYEDARDSQVYFFLEKIPLAPMNCYFRICTSERGREQMMNYVMKWSFAQPVMKGNDLRQMGFEPGPKLGEILKRLRAAVIDGEVRTKQDEIDLVETFRQED